MQIIEEEPQSADNVSQKNPLKEHQRKESTRSIRSSRSNTPAKGSKKNLRINVKSTFSPKKNQMESPASPSKKELTKQKAETEIS